MTPEQFTVKLDMKPYEPLSDNAWRRYLNGEPKIKFEIERTNVMPLKSYDVMEDYFKYVTKPRIEYGKMFKNGVGIFATDYNRLPAIKEVIFSGPATIIFWADNTKTVVKCQDGEPDRMVGFAMAMCKKALGNKGNFNNVFKKFVEGYDG